MDPSKLNRYDEKRLYQYGGGSKDSIKIMDTEDIYKNSETLLKEYRILQKKYEALEEKYKKLKEST